MRKPAVPRELWYGLAWCVAFELVVVLAIVVACRYS